MIKLAIRRLLPVVVAMSSACATASGQATAVDSAILAARHKLVAYVRKDYLYAAQLSHPAQIRSARVALDSLLNEVSSGMIAGSSLGTLFQADSVSRVRKLSDEQFVAQIIAFWVGMSGMNRYSGVEQLETAGAVPVGRDTVLVVYRWTYRDKVISPYAVEAMARCPGGWCSDLPVQIPILVTMMRTPRGSSPMNR